MQYDNSMPIYMQIVNDLKEKMAKGILNSGEKLSSTRDMAIEYEVNPNTIQRVYKELEFQKLCFTKRGLGTFITEDQKFLFELKESMAKSILEEFMQKMYALGFKYEEIKNFIENF